MNTTVPATALDIYRMLPEGTRCEVLFNQLSMTPAPSTTHQFICIKLSSLVFNFLEKNKIGEVLASPVDVYFEDDQTVVQPDVLVVLNDRKDIIRDDGIYGAPDIVFEILSTNRIHDTMTKKVLYEKNGVKEYFIINQADKMVIMYTLNNSGAYELAYQLTGKITSAILNCSFDL